MFLKPIFPEYIEKATALYESAFPEIERRPTEDWIQYMTDHPQFKAQAIVDNNDEFCGFITTWHFDNFVYGEHFAICPNMRNGGVGGKAFDLLREQCGSTNLVIEVETPDDEMAIRRIGFYRRHAMELVEHDYLQPPYRIGGEYFPLLLMSTQPGLTLENFDHIRTTIHQQVYGVK